ncbi:HTTM domain-containing protein [Nevskia ramosa]|uniref:HTTM domain-containing protein n=1 Tax=Nevskia ramosa TaxID=64002 RepID=UPI0003FFCC46|nr:HTTM domain-containing protein [Nevskia ramosa]
MIPAWLKTRLDMVFGIDLRTLAVFRVMLGTVLLADQLCRAIDLTAFYTDLGVMPRDWLLSTNGLWRVSFHAANGEWWFAALLFGVETIAALLIIFGWRTRLALVIAFVLNASLLNRNPMVLLGGDILLTCLIFWAIFLPVAARASLDAALSNTPAPADNRHRSWASVGILFQVMSVYFFSAILKSGADWHNGTAVFYALSIDGYATPLGQWLKTFPQLTTGLTHYVWWLEMVGPILVFIPVLSRAFRFSVMAMLMAMHIGFIFCLELGPFPYISLTSLSLFAGGWLWDAAGRWRDRRAAAIGPQPLRIYYDRDCGFCLKSVLILRSLLLLKAEIAPAQDTPRAKSLLEANYSWVILDHDDHAYLKWPAFVILLRRSPSLAWAGWLLSGSWAVPIGNAVYDFVGRNRGGFGQISGALLPFHDRPFESGPIAQALAGFTMVVLLTWNFCTIHWLPERLYAMLTPPLRKVRLDQYWDMFAPFPSREDGWFVIPATLRDGTELDLLHPERKGISYDKPEYITHEWQNIRWHKYMERVWSAAFADNRLYYGRWLCRDWNTTHVGQQQLDTFKIIYMLEKSVPPGETPTVEQIVLWRHGCFAVPAATATK